MGYYVHTTNSSILIPHDSYPRICNHLLTCGFLNPKNMGGSCWSEGKEQSRHFSWVDTDRLILHLKANDLVAVFELFGFDTSTNKDGHLCNLSYDNKCGDEVKLFEYIAQVLDGTHRIDWCGEQGEHFRYLIKDHKFQQLDGEVIFEGDDE